MYCRYVHDEEDRKILIPGCWPVTHSGDINDCTCRDDHYTFKADKKSWQEIVDGLKDHIIELEEEIKLLKLKTSR